MVLRVRSFVVLGASIYLHITAMALVSSERAELALPSAKQLDFQNNHQKGCFFHVSVLLHDARPHASMRPYVHTQTQPHACFQAMCVLRLFCTTSSESTRSQGRNTAPVTTSSRPRSSTRRPVCRRTSGSRRVRQWEGRMPCSLLRYAAVGWLRLLE